MVFRIEQSHRQQFREASAALDRLAKRSDQAERSHREDLRTAGAALNRLETRIDHLECQVLVQLADLTEAQRRSSLTIQDHSQAEIRSISDQISQAGQRTDSAFADLNQLQRQIQESVSAEKSRLGLISDELSQAGRDTALALDSLLSGSAEISARSDRIFAELAASTFRTTHVEALLRTRLATQAPSISESFLPESEETLVQLAESLAVLRPLVPYPGWRFDVDWYNPDLSFQIRQRIWQHFTDRGCEAAVRVLWHRETHLSMYLNNDLSRQIFITGCIDPNEFAFLDRFLEPGMTFIDAGANEGIYSIFAAQCVGGSGTVWAFEPSERELGRLRLNADINALNLTIFSLGLSDSERDAELAVAENRHAGLNTLGRIPYAGVGIARAEHIKLVRLDDVVSKHPLSRIDMIKIDIEGGELNMLRGAVETLRRYRPFLLFELLRPALASQGASPEEVIEFLHKQGYTLYEFDPSTGLPTLARPLEYNNVGWSAFGTGENLIGVPEGLSLPAAVHEYLPVNRGVTST
jgi:FkbM family methyltransferase